MGVGLHRAGFLFMREIAVFLTAKAEQKKCGKHRHGFGTRHGKPDAVDTPDGCENQNETDLEHQRAYDGNDGRNRTVIERGKEAGSKNRKLENRNTGEKMLNA